MYEVLFSQDPTVTQSRNRATNLKATCERAPVKPLPVGLLGAIKTANDAVSDTTRDLSDSGCPWRCQSALTEQQFLSNLSTGGDTLLMERIWPPQRTGSVKQQQLL